MTFIHALILGAIEGITEYLPISSTFHLIWSSKFLGLTNSEFQKAFEVIIQGGAILAVVVLYWKTIVNNLSLLKKVIVAFIPTAIIGLVFYKIIKNFFFSNDLLQLTVFILVGVVFILFEKYQKNGLTKSLSNLSYQQAITVGIAQSLATIPGVSRSGAVMLALMYLGIKRDEAAVFSFLLAVPTLLAASGLDLVKSRSVIFTSSGNEDLLIIGFAASFLSALIFIKWFIGFLQKHTLVSFGVYRIALGIVLLLLMGV